ncbi:bifunctional helix-turn-helix transcriptional regulator/GNAT family N-acetyltransferase [Staphylospora marina]|uniref:bifunctional helix-turn-helix transcriptional regulator/GNAT family N-acetyltransferase n=1 Tax=Staphylospora marina TaxID=2490858 RepID=UPI000F5C26EE|nr:bifunctional helix-turn-helix transcriptional regulator/GNAT family N-acetyltransferase [Staphylospora marina]
MKSMEEKVNAIRRFNRFFTRQIGVLQEGLLHSPYSLTEARVLFELAQDREWTMTGLSRELGMDPGYLSRILQRFEQKGLIEKVRSDADARQRILSLTEEGRKEFAILDKRSGKEVAEWLEGLPPGEDERLLQAMKTIEEVFVRRGRFSGAEPFLLREPEPGDMGWVIHRHGVLYAREYGWNEQFEALVARIVSEYLNHHDPDRERCWIAEMNGKNVGSVFVTKDSEEVARLRLLLVEPEARGFGLGRRLVEECIRFARRRGYKKMVLWTNSVLKDARRIYKNFGFELVHAENHHMFGEDEVGETWELTL